MMTLTELRRDMRRNYPSVPTHWQDGWLLHVLQAAYDVFIARGEQVITDDVRAKLLEGMDKMASGMPLAYLVGEQGFYGHVFLVDEYTLIPRPDSELVVETALAFAKESAPTGRLLDLGTGSGCLAISLAKALPSYEVWAVDKSAAALKVAMRNAERLQATNCHFCLSDWYQQVVGRFDIIVANPPYIDGSDPHLSALSAEPISALVADDQGFADIAKIVAGAGMYLYAGGLLVIEHGYAQAQQVQALLSRAGFCDISTAQDLAGNARVTLGVWYG